jgi:hypothetical protein
MFRLLAFVFLASNLVAPVAQCFYVDKIIVYTRYDSQYLIRRQNAIVPPGKLLGQKDVDCLGNELRRTGLFASLQIRLLRRTADTRTIEVTAKYRPDFRTLLIGEIVLKDLPEVNEILFLRLLADNGIKIGDRLMDHYFVSLEEKIAYCMRRSLPADRQTEYGGVPWITFEVTATRTVRIIVTPVFGGCAP